MIEFSYVDLMSHYHCIGGGERFLIREQMMMKGLWVNICFGDNHSYKKTWGSVLDWKFCDLSFVVDREAKR